MLSFSADLALSMLSKSRKALSSLKIFVLVLLLALLSMVALYANGGELQGRFGKSSIMDITE